MISVEKAGPPTLEVLSDYSKLRSKMGGKVVRMQEFYWLTPLYTKLVSPLTYRSSFFDMSLTRQRKAGSTKLLYC